MNNLKNIGVKTIINLRAFHSDKDETGNTGLFNEEISVNTWYIKDKDVIRVLRIVLEKQNGLILIHCQHGADRTGIMIAMYRIVEQGWSKDEAIREMVDGGYGFHSIWSNAIDYVKNVDIEKFKDEVTWLQEKPVQATVSPRPRDIGSAKSYLIPALKSQPFVSPQHVRPACLSQRSRAWGKNLQYKLVNFLGIISPYRSWGVDHDTFSGEPVRPSVSSDPCIMDSQDQQASIIGNHFLRQRGQFSMGNVW